jgi:hypothetical protein
MGTIARDPMFAPSEPETGFPARSALPPGGSPAIDLAYEKWLQDFVATANLRWCDKHWPDVPDREILKTYQLTGHLYKNLIGCEFPPGHGPNYLHRLRFVAVQFKLRPEDIHREANRYLVELVETAIQDQE